MVEVYIVTFMRVNLNLRIDIFLTSNFTEFWVNLTNKSQAPSSVTFGSLLNWKYVTK